MVFPNASKISISGTYEVSYSTTTSDASGNAAIKMCTYIVEDKITPTMTCPINLNIEAQSGYSVTVSDIPATDNKCDRSIVRVHPNNVLSLAPDLSLLQLQMWLEIQIQSVVL
jgi:hypothetical protein